MSPWIFIGFIWPLLRTHVSYQGFQHTSHVLFIWSNYHIVDQSDTLQDEQQVQVCSYYIRTEGQGICSPAQILEYCCCSFQMNTKVYDTHFWWGWKNRSCYINGPISCSWAMSISYHRWKVPYLAQSCNWVLLAWVCGICHPLGYIWIDFCKN